MKIYKKIYKNRLYLRSKFRFLPPQNEGVIGVAIWITIFFYNILFELIAKQEKITNYISIIY